MSKVDMRNIDKSFGRTNALKDFSLTIPEGSLVSLLGPSGCGKTTALRILAGLLMADQGQIFVDGVNITNTSAAERDIGMVFQAYSLFPNMSARENVEFGLKIRKVASNDVKNRVNEILEVIGLSEHQAKYPHQLSGGQQQRIALARAIAIRPRILLLDEPLSALDAQVRDQLRDEIRRVQLEYGITTLFVTHDQEEAMTISDQVGVMHQGSLLQIGNPQEVYENPANPIVARFVGAMNEIPVTISGSTVEVFGKRYEIAPNSMIVTSGTGHVALVRPENLSVSTERSHGQQATVVRNSFLGPISQLHLKLQNGLEVTAVLASAEASTYVPHQEVSISAEVDNVLIAQ